MSTGQYQVVPIEQLHESPLNPRKTFDPKAMEDLTASVRAKGVITPLLVRPRPDGLFEEDRKGRTRVREDLNGDPGFEIASGHRRYRAAKAAGLAEVPSVVRPMDDVTFLEVLIMENDEREDLHPLEEAQGYKTLMTRAGYSIELIAERRGCSVKYLYDRVKLLSLIPEAQALFREGRFTAGHAILLARLKPEDQKRAIDAEDGGLFTHENLLWTPEEEGRLDDPVKPVSVRELQAWIDKHVRFDPAAADPMLFPEAVAVVGQAQVEEEKVVKITHDHYVQPEARDDKERTFGPQSWRRADGKLKSKRCEGAVTGVLVAGPGRGEAFKVCIDKKGCKVHWATEQREAKRRATSPTAPPRTEEDREKQRIREERERTIEQETDKRFAKEILEDVKWPLAVDDVAFVITMIQDEWGALGDVIAFKKKGKPTPQELARMLVGLALGVAVERDWGDIPKALAVYAKRHKVDRAAIAKEVKAQLKAEEADDERDDRASTKKKGKK